MPKRLTLLWKKSNLSLVVRSSPCQIEKSFVVIYIVVMETFAFRDQWTERFVVVKRSELYVYVYIGAPFCANTYKSNRWYFCLSWRYSECRCRQVIPIVTHYSCSLMQMTEISPWSREDAPANDSFCWSGTKLSKCALWLAASTSNQWYRHLK